MNSWTCCRQLCLVDVNVSDANTKQNNNFNFNFQYKSASLMGKLIYHKSSIFLSSFHLNLVYLNSLLQPCFCCWKRQSLLVGDFLSKFLSPVIWWDCRKIVRRNSVLITYNLLRTRHCHFKCPVIITGERAAVSYKNFYLISFPHFTFFLKSEMISRDCETV